MGSDAYWSGSYSKNDFGYTVKYVTQDGSTQKEYMKRRQVEGWRYSMILFAWMCNSGHMNEMWNGYPDAGGGNAIRVNVNFLPVLTGEFSDDEVWTIEGRPIKAKMPVIGKWKGYDVMATNGGHYADQNNEWYILITRKDMSPYIPVTRKQYLDRAIAYITKFYNQLNTGNEQIQDKAERDENNKRNMDAKDIAVKNLQNELQKTTKDGLLSAPAVVRPDAHFQTNGPVFLTESEGGVTLVSENPDYFRKDLPAYVPQFFVLSWSWGLKKQKWEMDFKKAIEENFPIEKLQVMIDK
jgi:cation transport regulator ChaB